jgi:hypothetical protein
MGSYSLWFKDNLLAMIEGEFEAPPENPCTLYHRYCGQLLPLSVPWGGVGTSELNLAFYRRICHLIYRNPQRPR